MQHQIFKRAPQKVAPMEPVFNIHSPWTFNVLRVIYRIKTSNDHYCIHAHER
ncbi:MAG TPA: hypothetical protein VJK52_03175 [Candidatus Nanoarchaeia archaeon]|nr:hypothetical protein [Candidatus Nanoarchaeia archaeon]